MALANWFVFGNDDYPKDTTQALALLKNYKHEGGKGSATKSSSNDESPGVAFAQPGAGWVKQDTSKDERFICGKKGHYGKVCTSVTPAVRGEHLAKRYEKNQAASQVLKSAKGGTAKVGTQHTAVAAAGDNEESVQSMVLEADGYPSRQSLLDELGWNTDGVEMLNLKDEDLKSEEHVSEKEDMPT